MNENARQGFLRVSADHADAASEFPHVHGARITLGAASKINKRGELTVVPDSLFDFLSSSAVSQWLNVEL